jgi:hypothetical protein
MSLQKIEERMSVLVAAMEALLPQMSSVEEQRLQGYCHSPSHQQQRLEQEHSCCLELDSADEDAALSEDLNQEQCRLSIGLNDYGFVA